MRNIMNKSKIDQIRNHYIPRIDKPIENFEILDWASKESQHLRFDQLTRFLNLDHKSLLDVGCGLADLPVYLADKKFVTNYFGVDILPEMVSKARQNFPAGHFASLDIFCADSSEIRDLLTTDRFDIVYCSGALNLNLSNNLDFVAHALKKMLSLTQEKLVVTLLHARQPIDEPQYFAYYPEDIIKILKPICKDIQIVDDYLYNDFTVICES